MGAIDYGVSGTAGILEVHDSGGAERPETVSLCREESEEDVMSEFAKRLQFRESGYRAVAPHPLDALMKVEISCRQDAVTRAREYQVGIKLAAKFSISEKLLATSDRNEIVNYQMDHARRMLVESVFGEFRLDLIHLRRALYDEDYQTLEQELTKLETKMFSLT